MMRIKLKIQLISWVAILLIAQSLPAQNGWGIVNGPSGGYVASMASTDSGVLYAATANGIYKSFNDGDSWSQILFISCSDILVDNQNKLYATTSSGYLISSVDEGASFQISTNPLPGVYHKLLKSADNDLFLFSDPYNSFKVFRSVDDGLSWDQQYDFETPIIGDVILVDGSIVIATAQYGIFRSDDKGLTFHEKNSGIIDGVHAEALSIVVNSSNKLFTFSQSKIYSSTNKGETWDDITYNLSGPFFGKMGCATNGDIFLFDIIKNKTFKLSADSDLWELTSASFPSRLVANGFLAIENTMFYYSNSGIDKSSTGFDWRSANSGVLVGHFEGFALGADNSIVVTCDIGIAKYKHGVWESSYPDVKGPILSSGDYLFTKDLRSVNFGESWTSTNTIGLGLVTKDSLSRLYGYALEFQSSDFVPKMYRSDDFGLKWQAMQIVGLPKLGIVSKGIFATNNAVYMVGMNLDTDKHELYKVDLAHATSSKIFETDEPAHHITFKGGILYLIMDSGLFRSDDEGVTWKEIYSILDPITNVAVAPFYGVTGQVLWIGGLYGEIKYSLDHGETWTDESLPSNDLNVRATNFIVDQSGIVYITLNNVGVIISNLPLIDPKLLDPIILTTAIWGTIENVPNTNHLIYPNPVQQNLSIDWGNLNSSKLCKISILDSRGRKVIEQLIFTQDSSIDVSSLAPGSYFIRILQGDTEIVKKFVKL